MQQLQGTSRQRLPAFTPLPLLLLLLALLAASGLSSSAALSANETDSTDDVMPDVNTYVKPDVKPDADIVTADADGESSCSGTSEDLRHWATLELRGLPVFVHQRLDRKGHFLIEPLASLPDLAATLNASCVKFDRLTSRYYVSFPVALQDDEVLFQAREQLRHVAPKSVAFMRLGAAQLLSERLPGGWWLDSFRFSSEGRMGYLRINCPDHNRCVELRSQLLRHEVGIFERILLRLDAASEDGCVAIGNLTRQVTVPQASQVPVALFSRPKRPSNCTTWGTLNFFRELHVNGHQVFVMREAAAEATASDAEGGGFWLEPMLAFNGLPTAFRNASGWPGLSLKLQLRDSATRHAVAGRLRLLLGDRPLRFLHLVDYRLSRRGLVGVEVEELRLAADRASASLRLMALNATEAGENAIAELGRQITANPTLLFDALSFNFSFSADDACQSPYWTQRRVATPGRSQYRVLELQRSSRSPACVLSRQPQLEKVAQFNGLPVILWRRIDLPASAGRHFLIEPLMFYKGDHEQVSVEFDYTRGEHFVSMNITVQSPQVAELMRRNLTYQPARSVAFMHIRNLSLAAAAVGNASGVASVEFYLSSDQRDGFLRLYCENKTACAGLKNYLKSSELLLERLRINITMATPDDDACVGPEPIPKLIAAPRHLFDLAYLREKSPSRLECTDAAFPLVQTPLQPPSSCQLVVHRSLSVVGNRTSYFLEPAFCFLGAERQFDYMEGRSFLGLRLRLANASLLPGVRQSLRAADDATLDFMELWSLKVTSRTRLPWLETGAFKASFDRGEAELRLYCGTADACWKLHANLRDNNTVMLENFDLEMTASLPSYDCWMPRPMRKQLGSPNSTYFDLSYLNSKTNQLPGCPKELPITLFALKVIDSCPTFVYKREDAKAGFYIEPQFCFNGRVQYGFNYLASSHYVSFGVDLNRDSTLAAVTAQLADLAPKRVAFLEVRKVMSLNMSLGDSRSFLLDGFHVTVDRREGAFRVLCANKTACTELGSNVTLRPWILFERLQLESTMANGIDCELSTSTYQQPSSQASHAAAAAAGFHLPLDIFRLKLPNAVECKSAEAPTLFQVLTVDGCLVRVYKLPPPEKSGADIQLPRQQDLLIEPLLCFHGNALNTTARGKDYLSGEDYVSLQLVLQSHAVLKAVQDQLSLPPGSGSLKFAQLWSLEVVEEAAGFNGLLRVTQVGVAANQLTAELRVACREEMCDALIETLAEEPTDYLKSVLMSVTSLVPSSRCYFNATASKRPITIGHSRSSVCGYDYVTTTSTTTTTTTTTTTPSPIVRFQQWISRRCSDYLWSNCIAGRDQEAAYFFSRGTKDRESARTHCQSLGGDLATISGSLENSFVSGYLTSDSWIAPRKSGYHSEWVNSDGSRVSYTNFRSENNYYNCASMNTASGYPNYYPTGAWAMRQCYESLRYICKVRRRNMGW